jgi:hypothetical protein
MATNSGYVKATSPDALELDLPYGATVGRVAGYSRIAVYGHTPTPTANSDVWEGAGLYPFQAAATKLEILSSSASDTAAGTGARTMMVAGLDTNFNPVSEVITLAGVTPVQSVNSYLRVNGLNVVTAGSGGQNAGDITLRVTGAGATQAIARALYGYAKQAIYTVPTGFSLLVTDVLPECSGNGNSVNVVHSFTRISATGVIQTTNEYNTLPGVSNQRTVITGALVPATSSVVIRITSVGGAPSGAFASINGLLIDNTQLT